MSSFNNTSSIIETFLNSFQSKLETFKTGLDKSDLYEEKLVNMAKFEKFLAEFVKTHIDETFIENKGRNTILTQIYGDNFNDLSDERIKIIIDAATKDEFAHIKAKIQALSDLLILTMEGGEGQIGKLFQRIDNKLHATGLSIVNSVRTYMGYAALEAPPVVVRDGDLTPEMSDGDIVRALLALEHDPNDHSVLYASGLTLPTHIVTEEDPNPGSDLIKEVKKIMFEKVKLREVIVDGKIPNHELQPFIVNRNELNSELEELGNVHTSDTLEYDTAAIRNLITHFIRKTSRVTRNAVTEVKKLIDTLEAKLRNPEKTEHTIILGAIKKMKEDIFKAENYVSPAGKTFIVQRIFSKSSGLLKTFVDGPLKTFMDTLVGEDTPRNRIIEISDELLANRETLKALLQSNGLFDDIGGLGLNEDEMDELKETFITLLLTGGDTQTIVDAMPNQGQEVNNKHSLMDNESRGTNDGLNFLGVFNEDPVVVNENQQFKRAKLMPKKNNKKNNNNASVGGKRKKTAKKNNKKSKVTKKMKKIKRTMKKKTGKKAKKTSRRRR